MSKKTLCIIPIRTASRRLPVKNFRTMVNKPLYYWILEEVVKCKSMHHCIDKIVISTDAKKKALIAEDYDYIQRPNELSMDETKTEDVIRHIIEMPEYRDYDIIMWLQVTTPLTMADDIIKAKKIFVEKDFAALVTVNELYYPNGAIYMTTKENFIRNESVWVNNLGVMMMENRRSIDIDYPWDFYICQAVALGNVFNGERKYAKNG